jgi:hypothetical protein
LYHGSPAALMVSSLSCSSTDECRRSRFDNSPRICRSSMKVPRCAESASLGPARNRTVTRSVLGVSTCRLSARSGSLVDRREMLVAESKQGSLIAPGAAADRRQVWPLDQWCIFSLSRSMTGASGPHPDTARHRSNQQRWQSHPCGRRCCRLPDPSVWRETLRRRDFFHLGSVLREDSGTESPPT